MHTALERPPICRTATRTAVRDRRVVLTGGSAGIGRALVDRLVARDASVHVGSRRAVEAPVEHRPLDLACLDSVAAFADELVRVGRPIDLLILNAGVHVPWQDLSTEDGYELHWQVNHLANVLLCHRLLEMIRASELRRVVYVASEAHRLASLPSFLIPGFWRRYARSKEAAVGFFHRLQELHPELVVRVVSPGYVDSEVHRHKPRWLARLERAWSRPRSVDDAAGEILRIARMPSDRGGMYWDRGTPRPASCRCLDPAWVDELWNRSIGELGEALPDERRRERVATYARTFEAVGPVIEAPRTVDELATVVRSAAAAGRRIRAVGARHSYNDGFFSRGCMVSIGSLGRVLELDREAGTVTCQGGISIGALSRYLDRRGYALRYSGNFGGQTLAGALATGTHGYGRDGGVMSELVCGMTVMDAEGALRRVDREPDLRAHRLGLGTLGVVVELTMAVRPSRPCRYEVRCVPRSGFLERLDETARRHEYLRFVPSPFDPGSVVCVTIDPAPGEGAFDRAYAIADQKAGLARWLVPPLRVPAVRSAIGRVLRVERHAYALRVPFSGKMFIGSGLVRSHPRIARAGLLAFDRPDWLNMELAVPLERAADFARVFEQLRPRSSPFATGHPYFSCRVVGATRSVLLAPNYGRDVVFFDLHADPADARSMPFLRELEEIATSRMGARPHWGKIFHIGGERLRSLYPRENVEAFLAIKGRYDPAGVFSNDYTRRVLGV